MSNAAAFHLVFGGITAYAKSKYTITDKARQVFSVMRDD